MIEISAEIGSVHDGSFGNACKLIEAVAECGASQVKFQHHIAEAESLPNAPAPRYFQEEPRMSYFKRIAFDAGQWGDLIRLARDCSLKFVCSPFSIESAELLEKLGIDVFKIASGEVTNLPLLERVAAFGKPVYLSSGMSSWEELDEAVDAMKWKTELSLMQCSSLYPCPPEKVGLNVMQEMRQRYGLPVGYSDHTIGLAAPLAAAAQGASLIEKHFTFARRMYGSDARHSMEPEEFKQMCASIREIEVVLNSPVNKDTHEEYREMKVIFQKSIVAAVDIQPGEVIKMSHLAFKKPGDGISAAEYRSLIGKRAVCPIVANQKMKREDVKSEKFVSS